MTLHRRPHRLLRLRRASTLTITLALAVPGAALAASSWSPTLIVNTEAFQIIDDTDTSANIVLRFGSGLDKNLTYERVPGQFKFDDDLEIIGTASGRHLHAQDLLTSSGATTIEINDPAATALLIDQNTDAFSIDVDSQASTKAGIRISMPSHDASANPHILFGYENLFDTNLFRSAYNALTTSGSLSIDPYGFNGMYRYDGASYNGNLTEARTTGGTAFTILANENPSNDYFYVGMNAPFGVVHFDIATAAVGISSLGGDYWNGSTWVALGVTDTTTQLTVDGTLEINPPNNWTVVSINGDVTSYYWLRIHANSANVTTAPTAYSVSPNQGYRMRVWSQADDAQPALFVSHNQKVGIGTSTPKTELEVLGTISGSSLHAQDGLTSSGTLVFEGAASGASLYLGNALRGAGLADCDDTTASKLLWDTTAGRFSCGTDQDNGTTYDAGKGLSVDGSNFFSLNDTLTGSSLEIFGTASGRHLHAQDLLTSSGQLIIDRPADSDFITLADSTNGDSVSIKTGTGDPGGSVSAQLGSLFLASDTGKTYRNNDGSTQWVELAASSGAHMAKMTRTAAQTMTATAYSKLAFDGEEYDIGNIGDYTTNDRFNITRSGKYLVTASWGWTTVIPDGTNMCTTIYKNGSATTEVCSKEGAVSVNDRMISDTLDLSAGDYLEMYIYNAYSSTVDSQTAARKPRMSVIQLDGGAAGLNGWTTTADSVFVTDTTDKVGIGTTSPAEKLDVYDDSGATSVYLTNNDTTRTGQNDVQSELYFRGRYDDVSDGYLYSGGAIKGFKDNSDGFGGGGLSLWTASTSAGGVTEKVRINKAGNVLVKGGGSSFVGGDANIELHGDGYINTSRTTTAAAAQMQFHNPNGVIGSIVTTNSSTAYNTTSDRRIKENITDTSLGLDTLRRLPVRDFSFKTDPAHEKQTGFIAQELYEIIPTAVTRNGDNGIDPLTGTGSPWSVDYGRITPLLAAAIKELDAKVTDIESLKFGKELDVKLAAFAARLGGIEGRLERLERRIPDVDALLQAINELQGRVAELESRRTGN